MYIMQVTNQRPNRLRELREGRELSMEAVALQVAKSAAQMSRYETGDTPIPDDVKAALAEFFGVTRAYLMGWDEQPAEVAA